MTQLGYDRMLWFKENYERFKEEADRLVREYMQRGFPDRQINSISYLSGCIVVNYHIHDYDPNRCVTDSMTISSDILFHETTNTIQTRHNWKDSAMGH